MQMLLNFQMGKYKQLKERLKAVTSASEILECRQQLDSIKVDETVLGYLMQLVQKSRQMSDLQLGASPRAALSWLSAAKAHAATEGKDFVTPDNIKFVAEPILRHRLILSAEAELEGVTVAHAIANLLKLIAVPR
jgi:MoxR-like ATPase